MTVIAVDARVLLYSDLSRVSPGAELLFGTIAAEVVVVSPYESDAQAVKTLWALHNLLLRHSELPCKNIVFVKSSSELVSEWTRLRVSLVVSTTPQFVACAQDAGIMIIQIGRGKFPTIAAVSSQLETSLKVDELLAELNERRVLRDVPR